ncbi:MAG TPA: histidine kinase [Candidatus Acidoferrales bacterium]|nr:histidine kinase [Candidatus Acidoferrales bacterium]
MQAARTPQQPRWYWIVSICLGLGLFDALQDVAVMRTEGLHHPLTRLFAAMLLGWLPWAFATPVVLRLQRQYPLQGTTPAPWLIHAVACVTIAAVSGVWDAVLQKFVHPSSSPSAALSFVTLSLTKFYGELLSSVVLYSCVLLVGHMLESRERLALQRTEAARLNEQLSKAQLNALRHQIEPHFLFNTLNAISGLVREERNEAAVGMIAGLSDLLRHTLKDSNTQEIPLEEELQFLQKYLDIQKIRFADRLQLSVDIDKELFSARVPSFVLQPIVENALKHGIAARANGGVIRITAIRSNGLLTFRVYNDGPSLPAGWENNRSGVGISNVRTRLQSLYGNAYDLKIRNQTPGGVEVLVSVPFRRE